MITGIGESVAPIIEETSHLPDHVMYFVAGAAVGPSLFGINKLWKWKKKNGTRNRSTAPSN